jgi:hypothetical protein
LAFVKDEEVNARRHGGNGERACGRQAVTMRVEAKQMVAVIHLQHAIARRLAV